MAKEIAYHVRNGIGWLASALVLIILFYTAAGMVGGSIPANPGWKPSAQGVRILIENNGIHTGLVLPVRAAGIDWSATFLPGDIVDERYARLGWVAVGWGDRAFYIETPNWGDIRPATVARAAIGSSRTVLHVEYVDEPAVASDVRAILLSEDEYRRLADFVRGSLGPGGKVAGGYGVNDVFYNGRGSYNALTTCNEWTGRALRHAGVRTGLWTPFPLTVMAWF